jgi:hypothetical protein
MQILINNKYIRVFLPVLILSLVFLISILSSNSAQKSFKRNQRTNKKTTKAVSEHLQLAPEKRPIDLEAPFDNLYIINHPARTDRYDRLELIMSRLLDTLNMFRHLNLEPKVIDGTDALPYANSKTNHPTWRAAMESHRRAIRQVVLNRDRVAVIFEDDIDLGIHSILTYLQIWISSKGQERLSKSSQKTGTWPFSVIAERLVVKLSMLSISMGRRRRLDNLGIHTV